MFSSDTVWRQILGDLNAVLVDSSDVALLDFDNLSLNLPISINELRVAVFGALDNPQLVANIVGDGVVVSPLQARVINLLYNSGGMSIADMKIALGYAPGATTHAVDTAIYGLRKMCGHDLIQNVNGVYKLGRV